MSAASSDWNSTTLKECHANNLAEIDFKAHSIEVEH